MTSVQRVPVIEEVLLSDSDDEVVILDIDDPPVDKNVLNTVNESARQINNKFPSQNIKFTIEQVYLQGDFDDFDVPDSSNAKIKNSKVNSTSNESKHNNFMDHESRDNGAETDDDQFYIDEDAKEPNTACDEAMDLSLTREDERLSNISSSGMSPSSKSDDEKFSSVSSVVESSKELPQTISKSSEKTTNNVFKEDMELENTTSDDELTLAEGDVQKISMPARHEKQFRVRGKSHVETICVRCNVERRMSGKLWQNKSCRFCKENLVFQCANCKKRFNSYHSTLCHLKKECLSQQFWKCPQCRYSVLDEKKLEEHIKRSHVNNKTKKQENKQSLKEGVFVCTDCDARFKWKSNLEKHECPKREIHRCQMCDYTNNNKSTVKRHFTNSHVKGRWGKLKNVMKSISKFDMRPICVPDITSSSNMGNETKRKTEEETRAEEERLNNSISLHCSKCSLNFKYTGAYGKKCETCKGPLLWQCIPCNELSKSYCGIYEHLQNSCSVLLHTCSKCSKKFHSLDDLEKHHHICGQDLYLQCELCDFKTRVKDSFLNHVKIKHDLQGDEIRKWL